MAETVGAARGRYPRFHTSDVVRDEEPVMNAARTLHLSAAVLLSLGAAQVHATEYGTVVSSTPVLGQSGVPERNCFDEQVAVAPRPSGGGAVVGALLGGAVGNAVGAGMGRAAATAIGAVAGAA